MTGVQTCALPIFYGSGSPFYNDPYGGANPDDEMDGVQVRDLFQFIGGNAAYFLMNFSRMKQSGRPISFNFSALFFGWKYLLYRKMYGLSILVFLVNTLLSLPAAICLYEDLSVASGLKVKTEDLIEGIRARKFFAVGLDVYEEEKRNVYEDRSDEILESSITSRLLSFPNVLITSHQGFFTEEALGAISETTLKNAAAFAKGESTGNEVE